MKPTPTHTMQRIEAIDFARGMAITLMILSHGVKGLLSFDRIPDWGLVPIHLVTKFSSSLFILIFGISLAVVYLPHVDTEQWKNKRTKLLLRGVVVFFWYKVLTIVEMAHLYSREDILSTLLFQAFPVYVEILGYYAIALLWIPLALPLWKKMPRILKLATPLLFMFVSILLQRHFDFWGLDGLQALLVEHEKHYTWGQLSRAPLVFLGLLFGDGILRTYWRPQGRLLLGGFFAALAILLAFVFLASSTPTLHESLLSIARNEGKHPPELSFMLFSVGGSFLILSLSLLGGERLSAALSPVTLIGRNSLRAFIFHIFVLFIFYRYLLSYWQNVSYAHALTLTLLLLVLTALWIKTVDWVQKKS